MNGLCCGKRLVKSNRGNWHSTCVRPFFGTSEILHLDINGKTLKLYPVDLQARPGRSFVRAIERKEKPPHMGRCVAETVGFEPTWRSSRQNDFESFSL